MTTCKECGRQVVFGRTETGTKVMLDVGEPIYDLVIFDSAKGDYVVRRRLEARAAHRWVCPAAKGKVA
jgi:hypothetical protein